MQMCLAETGGTLPRMSSLRRVWFGEPGSVPGDGVLHPVVLLAIGLLIVNDHVLKAAAPGWLTGKLSDVAGLVFAPIVLQAAWELVTGGRGSWRPSATVLGAAIAITGIGFAAIKLLPAAADLYGRTLGLLQWPFHAVAALVSGSALPGVLAAPVARDPTDLMALIGLAVAYWVGRSRVRAATAAC